MTRTSAFIALTLLATSALAAPSSPAGCDITAWPSSTLARERFVNGQLACPGDASGDGKPDLVFAALEFTRGTGRLFGWHGDSGYFSEPPAWDGNAIAATGFGLSLAAAGDVNGDGLGDVVVSTLLGGPSSLHLFLGHPGGFAAMPDWSWTPGWPAVAYASGLGDVNGDGYDDIACSDAWPFATGTGSAGVTYVFHGGPAGPGSGPDGQILYHYMGTFTEAHGVGDVNGDGYDDVVIGMVDDDPATQYPKIRLYLGQASGVSAPPAWETDGPPVFSASAIAVSPAGDIDRDGRADVLLGFSNAACPAPGSGCVQLWRGAPAGLELAWTADVDPEVSSMGMSVAAAGDLDGDGWPDVSAVGSMNVPGRPTPVGTVHAWFGSPAGLAARPGLRYVASGPIDDRSERALTALGDIDGDGADDMAFAGVAYASSARAAGVEILYGRLRNQAPEVSLAPSVSADCGAVPLVASASDRDGDPLTYTWTNDCPDALLTPNSDVPDPVVTFDGGCGRTCTFTVEVDDGRCGITTATTRVTIRDRTPPTVTPAAGELACVWPPNGRRVTYHLTDFSPSIVDACDANPSWRFAGCVAEEDGVEVPGQCGIAADGMSLWLRARRSGSSAGRQVSVIIEAIDACGNVGAPTRIGVIRVPHDQRSERCPAARGGR